MNLNQILKDEVAHIQHLLQKWEGKAVTEVNTLVTDATPLFKQMQTTLTADVYAAAKLELTTAIGAALTGGGLPAIGAAIAATIPQLIAKFELDGEAQAQNALHALAAIVQAQVTEPATAVA